MTAKPSWTKISASVLSMIFLIKSLEFVSSLGLKRKFSKSKILAGDLIFSSSFGRGLKSTFSPGSNFSNSFATGAKENSGFAFPSGRPR